MNHNKMKQKSDLKFYEDFFEEKFIEKFGEYANEIREIELDIQNPAIDLNKICNILKINLVEDINISESGEYNSETRTIKFNSFEPLVRQRFTIAHELGHAVLKHEGISKRAGKYIDYIEKSKEILANKFASNLLMPRKLVVEILMNKVVEEGWTSSALSDNQVEELTIDVAKKLKVSASAMQYSIQNNNIFYKNTAAKEE